MQKILCGMMFAVAFSAAAESVELIRNGTGVEIRLPSVTELDAFLATTPEATRAAEAKRFPKATAEELDQIVARRLQELRPRGLV